MTEEEKLQFFNDNMKLVYLIVNKHWGKHYVETDDLIQEAMMMFWKALNTYDENKSTNESKSASIISYVYAVIYTHLNVYTHTYRYGKTARSPHFQNAMRANKYARENKVSINTACDYLGLTEEDKKYVPMLTKGENFWISLSAKIYPDEESDLELGDIIADNKDVIEEICSRVDMENLYTKLYTDFLDDEVQKHRGKNKERFRKAVIAFLDSIFVEHRTYDSVATELNLSREMIRQYFDKLKKHLLDYLVKDNLIEIPTNSQTP